MIPTRSTGAFCRAPWSATRSPSRADGSARPAVAHGSQIVTIPSCSSHLASESNAGSSGSVLPRRNGPISCSAAARGPSVMGCRYGRLSISGCGRHAVGSVRSCAAHQQRLQRVEREEVPEDEQVGDREHRHNDRHASTRCPQIGQIEDLSGHVACEPIRVLERTTDVERSGHSETSERPPSSGLQPPSRTCAGSGRARPRRCRRRPVRPVPERSTPR